MSRDLKLSEWRRRMARFDEADVSVSAFCRAERVSVPSFYQWRKRLEQLPREASMAQGSFVPVRVVTAASIVAQLPGGTQLQIPTVDPQTIRAAIEALVHADAEQAGGGTC
jgi:hypothetical protein